jgi:hypothetical protein
VKRKKMNSSKLVLVAIAIVAVGLFALPSSVSLFSGQHTWYDLGVTAGSDVPCEKCHADIQDEMISAGNGVHESLAGPGCDCHRVNGTGVAKGGYGGNAPVPGTTSHAAETIACMICHEDGKQPAYPFAGGFSQTAIEESAGTTTPYNYSYPDGSGGEHAAHNQFIGQAIHDDLMEDSNEACIACHTRVGVCITWTKNEIMDFQAHEDDQGDWTVSDFKATGSNVTVVNSPNEWT